MLKRSTGRHFGIGLSPMRAKSTFGPALVFALACSSPAHAALVNWVPAADGDWDGATNWSSNPGLPGATDDVTISTGGATLYTVTHDSGTDTVNSLLTDETLSVTGGSLTVTGSYISTTQTNILGGTGTLRLNGASSMTSLALGPGGTLTGAGTVTVDSPVAGTVSFISGGTISGASTLQFNDHVSFFTDADKSISGGRTVNLAGTAAWVLNFAENANRILMSGGSKLNNLGTWTDGNAFDTAIVNQGGVNQFNNSGTYNKTTDVVSTIGVAFNNTGTVNIDDGTLRLTGGGSSAGTFAGLGELEFDGGSHQLTAASNVTVDRTTFSAGDTTVSGMYDVDVTDLFGNGTVNFNAAATTGLLSLSPGAGGAVTLGGTATLSVSTALWNGGTQTGTGTTLIEDTLTSFATGDLTLSGGRTLDLRGTTNWFFGRLNVSGGSTIANRSGAIWNDFQAVGTDIANLGGLNQFNNAGVFNRVTPNESRIAIAFNNNGIVNILSPDGALKLSGGGSSAGLFLGLGTLEFGGGVHTLTLGSNLSTTNLRFSGGTTATIDGLYAPTGTFLGNGTANLNSAAATSNTFEQTGGTLGGTGTLTISAASIWTAGTQTGAGTTRIDGNLDVSSSADKTVSGGRTLRTAGVTTWRNNSAADTNRLLVSGNSTINNAGDWRDENAFNAAIASQGGNNVFNNDGTYTKSGASDTTITIGFNNNTGAVVTVSSGTLNLDGGGNSAGNFLGAGTLDFGGGTHTLSAASSTTVSNLVFSGGTTNQNGILNVNSLTISNAGTANLNTNGNTITLSQSAGTLGGTGAVTATGPSTWTGGAQTGTGTTRYNATLTVSGQADKTLAGGRTLLLTNSSQWSGNTAANGNRVLVSGNSTIDNAGIWSDLNTFDSAIQNSGGSNVFKNGGIYNKSGSSQTSIGIAFNNAAAGSVNVNAGTLNLSGGGSSAGDFAGSGSLQFTGGTHVLAATSDVTVATVGFTGGTTNLGGTYNAANTNLGGAGVANFTAGGTTAAFNQSGGTLGGGATVRATGPASWTAGTQTGTGTTQLDGSLAISGQADKTLSGGRTLNTNGTTTWSGNTAANGNRLLLAGNSTLNNSGSWQDQNGFASAIQNNGGNNTFNNSGTYTKSGAGQTTVSVAYNNTATGTTHVNAGTFSYTAGAFVNAGALSVATGATFTVSGVNDYVQSVGSTVINGTLNVGGNTAFINSGSLSGTGTLVGDLAIAAPALLGPGNSPGVFAVQGALNLAGTVLMELANATSFDRLTATTVELDPTSILNISLLNGFMPVYGASFDLFDWSAGLIGRFGRVELPALRPGLAWNTDQLHVSGTIAVEAVARQVPMPPQALWVLAGAMAVAGARRARMTGPAPTTRGRPLSATGC